MISAFAKKLHNLCRFMWIALQSTIALKLKYNSTRLTFINFLMILLLIVNIVAQTFALKID